MAAPLSRRAKILIALQAQLEKITQANGYATNVYKVTQEMKNWRDTSRVETPVIYIIDNTTAPKYNAGRLMEWEWSISLFTVMRESTQAQMEELISDIMQNLHANVTLYHESERLISHLRIMNIMTDGQFFSEIEDSQIFRVDINILYTGCVTEIR